MTTMVTLTRLNVTLHAIVRLVLVYQRSGQLMGPTQHTIQRESKFPSVSNALTSIYDRS